MGWLDHFRTARPRRAALLAEAMEPRLLFSADLSAALVPGAEAAAVAPEVRTLDAHGEYQADSGAAATTATPAAAAACGALVFQPVQGGATDPADFVASGGGYAIALRAGDADLTFATTSGQHTVRLGLSGETRAVAGEGEGPLPPISGDPSPVGPAGTGNFSAVLYRGVYEGVDVRYYGNQQQLEYDFLVAPGADPGVIGLRFEGVESASIAGNGDLVLRVAGSEAEVRFQAPVSYQRGAAGLEPVASRYEMRPDGTIGFVVGAYDRTRELVIDPVLNYAAVVLPATPEDTPVTITSAQLLANASDTEGDPLSVANLVASSGTLTANGDGTWTFTPAPDDDAGVTFGYDITDGVEMASGSASLDLTPVNDAPIAAADSLTTPEDTLLVINLSELLQNDSDVEGSALSIVGVASGTGGTATLHGNGTISFMPAANFTGDATFTYVVSDGSTQSTGTVTVAVTPVNDAPVANDDSGTTTANTPITFTAAQLLGNDTDSEGDPLAIVSVTGGAVLHPDGSVTFTPAPDFTGTTSFPYKVSDGSATPTVGRVVVTVLPANDAPVAANDTVVARQDTPITYAASVLLGNDTDIDGGTLSIASVASGPGGTAVLNADGTVTFTPDAGFAGNATFTYQVTDGIATSTPATVTVFVNDMPMANADTLAATEDTRVTYAASSVLGNDTDAVGRPLSITGVGGASGGTAVLNADGSITFTPDANFSGAASFAYTVSDGTSASAATVTVNVAAVNDAPTTSHVTLPPVAEDGGVVTITAAQLLGNAADADGQPLAVVNLASNSGTLIANADGTWTFSPGKDFNGAVVFTYGVTDGMSAVAGSASLEVTPVNDAPVVAPDSLVPAPAPVPPDPPALASPSGPVAAAPASAVPAPTPAAVAAKPASEAERPGAAPPNLSDALGFGVQAPAVALNTTLMSFGAASVRMAVDEETARVFHSVVFDRAGLELISAQAQGDLFFARFGIDSQAQGARLEAFQRSIRSADFVGELDRLRESVREDLDLEQAATISVVSVSLGLSVVYVLWLIRGGVLLGSYLSALPAWRLLDPLPVLSRMGDEEDDDDEPLDVEGSDGRHTLRGFG